MFKNWHFFWFLIFVYFLPFYWSWRKHWPAKWWLWNYSTTSKIWTLTILSDRNGYCNSFHIARTLFFQFFYSQKSSLRWDNLILQWNSLHLFLFFITHYISKFPFLKSFFNILCIANFYPWNTFPIFYFPSTKISLLFGHLILKSTRAGLTAFDREEITFAFMFESPSVIN